MSNPRCKRVLVFPAGSEVGLEIERALRYVLHFDVIGATSVSDHSSFVYKKIEKLPFVTSEDFITELAKLVNRACIDCIFPAHDDVVELLPKLKEEGAISDRVEIIGSEAYTTHVARSKKKTYDILRGKVDVPRIYARWEVSENNLPLFTKPDKGQGSKGACKVSTLVQVESLPDDNIITEFLPGEEYTIDCFTDRHGELRFVSGRKRARVSNGISVSSQEYKDAKFSEIAQKINNCLAFRGAWFFQLKRREDGSLVLLEIAPRIAGGMGYQRAKGINLPLLSLYDRYNHDISLFQNSPNVTRDSALYPRYRFEYEYDSVYLDLDDTLIISGKVNPALIHQVYHWKNEGKKVFLITRHRCTYKKDPRNELSDKNIPVSIFDEIIEVPKGRLKSSYITETDSIFVDDSVAERLDVHNVKGIPTFTCQQCWEVIGQPKGGV